MFEKIYLEITNVCNFDCTFCHKTKREKRFISSDEFNCVIEKIKNKAKYLFFHLMGEPTLHPMLPAFINKAREAGFSPVLTTNGSLINKVGEKLLSSLPYKISISIHSSDANPKFSSADYLKTCIDFSKKAAQRGCYIALRLWNLGSGTDNSKILEELHNAFSEPWVDIRGGKSQRLADKIFLEWGEEFDWPDPSCEACDADADMFCYGLRDQIGILVDGTVVPCCLDADGNLALGNIFNDDIEVILASDKAKSIYNGFTRRRALESLCRKCGYARRFSRNIVK